MVLSVRAKALEAGAEGDTISVLNAQSNRVVQATVTGPGRVPSITRPRRRAQLKARPMTLEPPRLLFFLSRRWCWPAAARPTGSPVSARRPSLTAIDDPTASPGYKPVSLPMPPPEQPVYQANSLWRSGARGFFKDQRAMRIGDILTVKVRFSDSANINNQTSRDAHRQGKDGRREALRPGRQDPAGRER